MDKTLIQLKSEMIALGSQWDGDLPGKLEEQSSICGEIVDHIDAIKVLLEELEENS